MRRMVAEGSVHSVRSGSRFYVTWASVERFLLGENDNAETRVMWDMPKSKKPTHQPFEGSDPHGQFAKITHNMMTSPAWLDLNLRQQGLYLHLKAKYRQKKINSNIESDNRNDISLPKSEWSPRLYGDYRTFSKDIRKLEENGFIQTLRYGKATHQCNIYGFSDFWKKWKPVL